MDGIPLGHCHPQFKVFGEPLVPPRIYQVCGILQLLAEQVGVGQEGEVEAGGVVVAKLSDAPMQEICGCDGVEVVL